MKTGKVARKLDDKGFGFITVGSGIDFFFHTSQCKTQFGELKQGDRVRFDVQDSPKGPRAVDVERF